MSREIKFSYVFRNYYDKSFAVEYYTLEDIEKGKLRNSDKFLSPKWFIFSRDEFTGLKDKNGKDIYDGYIVKYTFHLKKGFKVQSDKYSLEKIDLPVIVAQEDERIEERIACIYWARGAAGFGLDVVSPYKGGNGNLSGKGQYEVIGNIYDNPELLKS